MAGANMLTAQLFVLGIAGLLAAYFFANQFFFEKKGRMNRDSLKAFAVPLTVLGVFAFVTGFFGMTTWPLPGSYNILFYDAYMLFGMLAISLGYALYKGIGLKYVGGYSFLAGIVAIYYGWSCYTLNMTKAPFIAFAMYAALGIAGIFGCPMSYALDKGVAGRRASSALKFAAVVIIVALFIGSIIAITLGVGALPEHLVSYATAG